MRVSAYNPTPCALSTANFLYAAQELSELPSNKKQLLLVEDNPLLQYLHSTWLEQLGFSVTIVGSGEAALEECLAHYDAVLMDLDLPGDDGITTTQKLLKNNPQSKIPIIACTSHSAAEMKDACISAGMSDYLQKPISPTALEKLLNILLACEV